MPLSFYETSVLTFLQTTRAVGGFLGRAADHCAAQGLDPDALVDERLHPDMMPLHFQVEALAHHAVFGLEAVRTAVFAPPPPRGTMPFADLQRVVRDAVRALEAFEPAEVDGWAGKRLEIALSRPVDEANAATSRWAHRPHVFTAETFLMSYTLPNFHFHAVTAYNILRSRGVPIGKRDYEGQLRNEDR